MDRNIFEIIQAAYPLQEESQEVNQSQQFEGGEQEAESLDIFEEPVNLDIFEEPASLEIYEQEPRPVFFNNEAEGRGTSVYER